jgi:hypothetical protein
MQRTLEETFPLAQYDDEEFPRRVLKLAHEFPGADEFETIISPYAEDEQEPK